MSKFWPRYVPSLPLGDARDDEESVGYVIKFKSKSHGKVMALVYNDFGDLVDRVLGSDFQDAYDTVREAYPQASWRNDAT